MGLNQHLIRSIVEMRNRGGLPAGDGTVIWPEPLLVGRNAAKVEAIAHAHGIERWTTDVDAAIADPGCEIFFDSATTGARAGLIEKAIAAGKHVYCEKPLASTYAQALRLAELARAAGVKNGIVHDKLYLPGFLKLKRLIESGFFGRILSLRGEFGYWVFEGDWGQPAQRPSWNYRAAEGGGIMIDMFCHWRYVLENLLGPVRSVSCVGATHIPTRIDENGDAYPGTADDAAYGMFEIDGGIIAQINSSWCTRVYRDELVQFQIDGTLGSAIVGLRDCKVQHRVNTPRPVWNSEHDRLLRRLDRGARQRGLRERLLRAVGAVPQTRRPRRTASVRLRFRSAGRATRGARLAGMARTALDRRPPGRNPERPLARLRATRFLSKESFHAGFPGKASRHRYGPGDDRAQPSRAVHHRSRSRE
jgi:predicted dehydrogenase